MAGASESPKLGIEFQLKTERLHTGVVIAGIVQGKVPNFRFNAIFF
jgi:hypothetical protein